MQAFCGSSGHIKACVGLDRTGLTLGAGSRLVRFDPRTGRLGVDSDRERCLALLAVATRTPVAPKTIAHLEAAAGYWDRGERALANLRLVFAGLPRIRDEIDAACLTAAEYLLDRGMTPRELLRRLEIDAAGLDLAKYDPSQPRVPAGQGKQSGEWTHGFWSGVENWLEEPVPIYDQDTGEQLGTQPRGWMIATNPLTIVAAAAAAVWAAGVVVSATGVAAVTTAVEPAALEAGAAVEELTPFAARYLSASGGRLGSTATRRQLYDIAQDFAESGQQPLIEGDGHASEEYIPGTGPGTKGTYVDLTVQYPNGSTVRIQTIDTLSDGVTPTKAEANAAARIRAAFPNDKLILIPKTLK